MEEIRSKGSSVVYQLDSICLAQVCCSFLKNIHVVLIFFLFSLSLSLAPHRHPQESSQRPCQLCVCIDTFGEFPRISSFLPLHPRPSPKSRWPAIASTWWTPRTPCDAHSSAAAERGRTRLPPAFGLSFHARHPSPVPQGD